MRDSCGAAIRLRTLPFCAVTVLVAIALITPRGASADDYAAMRSMWLAGKVRGSVLPNTGAPPDAGIGSTVVSASMDSKVRLQPNAPCQRFAAMAAAPPIKQQGVVQASRSVVCTGAPGACASEAVQLRSGGGISKDAPRKDKFRPSPRNVLSGGKSGTGSQTRECTVTLAFVSPHRFAASSSFPPKEVSDAYKMNMGRYEPDTKRWTFPFEQYDKLSARLQQLCRVKVPGFNLSFKGIPEAIVAVVREGVGRPAAGGGGAPVSGDGKGTAEARIPTATTSAAASLLNSLPVHIRDSLLPFQKEGVLFGLSRHGRVLIGDEMGLGKTIQAIAIAAAYMTEWPLLVVCPSSMRSVWAQEFVRWLPGLVSSGDVNVIHKCKDPVYTCPVTIISYDLFAKLVLDIRAAAFKVVIADESHYLKNGQAKRTMAIVPVVREAKRAILLTGTPALARPIELFNMLDCLFPRLFGSYLDYATRYCAAHQGPFGLDTGGACNLEELHLVLQKHAMIRRLKKNVLAQLPPKRRQRVLLQLPAAQAAQLGAQIEQLKELERQADDAGASDEERLAAAGRKRSLIMKLYVETGAAKVAGVCEYVQDLLQGGAKFLIFAHHLPVLDAVEQAVRRQQVKYIRIDGGTASSDRQRLVALFQQQQDVRVAVLSITAAGTGLTLTAADTVVFAELHWTPGVLLQAEDRVHRIGQESSSVNMHYLVAEGSCDELIWESIAHKMQVVGRALDGQGVGLWASSRSSGVRCDGGEGEAAQGRSSRQSRLPAQLSGCSTVSASLAHDDDLPPNPSLRASTALEHCGGAQGQSRGGCGGEAAASVARPSTRTGGSEAGGAGVEAGGLRARGGSSETQVEVGVEEEEARRQALGVPRKLGNSASVDREAGDEDEEGGGRSEGREGVAEGAANVNRVSRRMQEEEAANMDMLLAHPVVIRAMQNPRLDALLSRWLGVEDEQFLAECGDDAELVELVGAVRRVMRGRSARGVMDAVPGEDEAEEVVRPVAALRGGGTSVAGLTARAASASSMGEVSEPFAVTGRAGRGEEESMMKELVAARAQLHRDKQHMRQLQAELAVHRDRISSSGISGSAPQGTTFEGGAWNSGASLEAHEASREARAPSSGASAAAAGAMQQAAQDVASMSPDRQASAKQTHSHAYAAASSSLHMLRVPGHRSASEVTRQHHTAVEVVGGGGAAAGHARSRRGELVPLEFISASDVEEEFQLAAESAAKGKLGKEGKSETHDVSNALPASASMARAAAAVAGAPNAGEGEQEQVDAPELVQDLQNLAQVFPGCAQYLMNELDARRLLAKGGRTLTQDKIRRVMERVAARSQAPDVKVMALLIREKLSGGASMGQWQAGAKVSADLQFVQPHEAARLRRLRTCKCTMARGMRCTCGASEPAVAVEQMRSSRQSGQQEEVRGVAGSGEEQSGGQMYGGLEVGQGGPGGKRGRRRYGNVTVTPEAVAEKVAAMGGLRAVARQQGKKGAGWKTVAASLGVDVELFRDCGFQMKKLYYECAWRRPEQGLATAEVQQKAGVSGEASEATCEPMLSEAEAITAPERIHVHDACARTDVHNAGVAGAPMARAVKRRR